MLNDEPIVDGFCYAARMMDTPYMYQTSALESLDTLRRAKNFVPRIYALPDITNGPLANYSNFTGQVRVVDGSYLWAVSLGVFIDDNIGPPFAFDRSFPSVGQNGQRYFISVRDEGSGVPIFSDWVSETNLFVPTDDSSDNRVFYSILAPMPLSSPRPILAPGVLTVNISFTFTYAVASVTPQVLLYCAEPCNAGLQKVSCD